MRTLTLLLACGCLHMQPHPLAPLARGLAQMSTTKECKALDRRVVGLTASAVIAGGIGSAAGGLSSRFTDDAPKYSLAGISAGMSVAGAVMSYLSTFYAKQYADRCTVNIGGATPAK